MHYVAHYITVFFLLLFSLNYISIFVFEGKQIAVAASMCGDMIESSEMKNCQENDSQNEWLLNQRTGVPVSMEITIVKTLGHKSASFWSNTLISVLTPPPEVN